MDKETEKMFEILHENKKKEQELVKIDKDIKKHKKIAIVLGILIAILTVYMCVTLLAKEEEKFISDCVAGGLSENVCRRAS